MNISNNIILALFLSISLVISVIFLFEPGIPNDHKVLSVEYNNSLEIRHWFLIPFKYFNLDYSSARLFCTSISIISVIIALCKIRNTWCMLICFFLVMTYIEISINWFFRAWLASSILLAFIWSQKLRNFVSLIVLFLHPLVGLFWNGFREIFLKKIKLLQIFLKISILLTFLFLLLKEFLIASVIRYSVYVQSLEFDFTFSHHAIFFGIEFAALTLKKPLSFSSPKNVLFGTLYGLLICLLVASLPKDFIDRFILSIVGLRFILIYYVVHQNGLKNPRFIVLLYAASAGLNILK